MSTLLSQIYFQIEFCLQDCINEDKLVLINSSLIFKFKASVVLNKLNSLYLKRIF